jgi:hypothetical protein
MGHSSLELMIQASQGNRRALSATIAVPYMCEEKCYSRRRTVPERTILTHGIDSR